MEQNIKNRKQRNDDFCNTNIQSELKLYPGISEGGQEEGVPAKWEQEGNGKMGIGGKWQFFKYN